MTEAKDRIRWTSQQRSLVTAAIVIHLKTDLIDYRMKHSEDYLQSAFVRKALLLKGQLVLDRSFHRQHFTPVELRNFAKDVGHMWWKAQLDEEKANAILAGTSTDVLISEIASRQQDAIVEKLLDRLEGPLMARLTKKLEEMADARFKTIEHLLKHNPVMDGESRKEIPSYVVTGILPGHDKDLLNEFHGECKFTFIDADAKSRIATACRDKIVFVSKYTGHSTYETARNVAQKATFAHTLKDLKRLIRVSINEFNTLNTQ